MPAPARVFVGHCGGRTRASSTLIMVVDTRPPSPVARRACSRHSEAGLLLRGALGRVETASATSEQVAERGEELDLYRDIVDQASPPGHQAKARQFLAEGALKNNQRGTERGTDA